MDETDGDGDVNVVTGDGRSSSESESTALAVVNSSENGVSDPTYVISCTPPEEVYT